MEKSDGPSVRIELSCFDCRHERSESYAVQGDSGHDVYCDHPAEKAGGRYIGGSWRTPDWCPLRAAAIQSHIGRINAAVAKAEGPSRGEQTT